DPGLVALAVIGPLAGIVADGSGRARLFRLVLVRQLHEESVDAFLHGLRCTGGVAEGGERRRRVLGGPHPRREHQDASVNETETLLLHFQPPVGNRPSIRDYTSASGSRSASSLPATHPGGVPLLRRGRRPR